jgi:hypothetical protein
MRNENDKRQGGGPITASVNMWALLADNDPGDNPLVKRDTTTAALDDADVQQPVAAVEATAVPKSKKKRSKKKKKQHKERKPAAGETEEAEGARRGSNCVPVLVTAALVAFIVHVSASAASSSA